MHTESETQVHKKSKIWMFGFKELLHTLNVRVGPITLLQTVIIFSCASLKSDYRKVASINKSGLKEHFRFYRLFMKEKFYLQ